METVSSVEFQRNFGLYTDKALVEPVTMTKNGRGRIVFMSTEEYQRLKRRDRQVMTPADFTEKDIEDLKKAQAALEAEGLDHEWGE
ncbi:MAG: type II toxin-antitoxin system Phd/YefM family antitoxin [Pseudomonadota bacterium]|nr:type II toxin-antitoxin system Phd/YefM family antitoxin [Pseudomonadota bacterium]MDE3038438.1 type II toxin-antitoxin system Phd/YefM family antitoxin [Pseudomonadota bacterium]